MKKTIKGILATALAAAKAVIDDIQTDEELAAQETE